MIACILFLLLASAMVTAGPTIGSYVTFVRRFLFAPSDLRYSNEVIFDPQQGEVRKEEYQRNFGHQGRDLVEAYGKGLSKEELTALGFL